MLEDIQRGRFGFDCALPKEENLAKVYGVSRSTLRRMIEILEHDGVLSRRPRKGVWIGGRDLLGHNLHAVNASNQVPALEPERTSSPNTASSGMRRVVIDGAIERKTICAIIQADLQPGMSTVNDYSMVPEHLAGMSDAAFQQNASLQVHYVPFKNRERAAEPEFLPSALRDVANCGTVLIHYFPPEVVAQFAATYPCVSLMYDYKLPRMDIVGPNNVDAMGQLLRHLCQRGHRKIAFAGKIRQDSFARIRLAGFLEAIIELGLGFNVEDAFDFSDANPCDEVFAHLHRRVRQGVTAIVCCNDPMGFQVISQLNRVGIVTPRDVSVTGFDPVRAPEGLPQLTSIRVPAIQIGVSAVATLFERMRNPGAPAKRVMLDGMMIEGDSVTDVDL